MPLYPVVVAGWFGLFGVSLFGARFVSLLFGLLTTVCWYWIVGRLTRDRTAALVCAAMVGWNYDVLNVCTLGRTDMMYVGLSTAGMAVYLLLRERGLGRAVFWSQLLMAAALFTHPYAAFGMFAVAVLAGVQDRGRLRWRHLALAGLPYAAAAGAWLLYAAQAPEIAKAQLLGNVAAGRLSSFQTPLETLIREIQQRYIALAGGVRAGVPPAMRLRLLVFAGYLGAFVAGVCLARFRRLPGHGILLFLMAADFLLLTYFENLKWFVYLVNVIPVYACVLGLFLVWAGRLGRRLRVLAIAAAGAFLLFNVASILYRVRIDTYGKAFRPAAEFLREAARPGELIMGGSEYLYPLGFDASLKDDIKLGYLSRLQPVFIVVERTYQEWFELFRKDSGLDQHVRRQLSSRTLLFEVQQSNEFYRIYGPAGRARGRPAPH